VVESAPEELFREEELADRLGQVLTDIHIPDDVLASIQHSLAADQQRNQQAVREQRQRLRQRLAVIRQRLDQVYLDKLDGKIDAEFWERKSAEWRAEEQQVTMKLAGLDQASPDRLLNASRILELANKARFLYVSQNPAEKAKLLKMVLSNCTLDSATLYPTYRKPFDLIFHRAKNEEWRRERDSNPRYGFPYTRFRGARLQPLGHLSADVRISRTILPAGCALREGRSLSEQD
jgi:site-specific DNA recombinase